MHQPRIGKYLNKNILENLRLRSKKGLVRKVGLKSGSFIFSCTFFLFGVLAARLNAQTVTWSETQGPYTGSISLLTVDPAGDVFAMIPSAGIFRSTDGGQSWQKVNGLGFSLEPCLVADSLNDIYAGSLSSGLYESTDGGTSWHKASYSGAATAAAILPGDRICVGRFQAVSISSDYGKTWTTSSQITSDPVEALSIAGTNTGKIYAGFRGIPGSPATPPSGGGVFMSPDSGRTWTDYGQDDVTVSSIAVSEKGKVFVEVDSSVYSAVHAPIPRQGSNWSLDQNGIPLAASVIAVQNGRDGEVIALTDQGTYVYDDSTDSWTVVLPGIPSAEVTSQFYNPSGTSFAGTQGNGVFYNDSLSKSWTQCGIYPSHVTALGTGSAGELLVGTDNGIYERIPGSRFWQKLEVGLGRSTIYQIQYAAPDSTIYSATSDGLYSLTKGSGSWNLTTSEWTYTFLETPAQYYIGTSGGIMSTTYGVGGNWTTVQTVGLPLVHIYSLARDSSNVLYAGTQDAGIFSSTDGIFWTQIGLSTPLIFRTVKTIQISSNGVIFAGTDSAGAYYSDDAGADWNRISSITGKQITCFLLNDTAGYYAGTSDGVFVSMDRGVTWHSANDGLTELNVNSIFLDRQGNVYAGTDSGLFVSKAIETAIQSRTVTASSFSLSQNYPNPFNPSTAIRFVVPGSELVSLKVYDVLGRLVRTLLNKVESPGRYQVTFDAAGLASGVYFCRLEAGNYVMTRKMVLIR